MNNDHDNELDSPPIEIYSKSETDMPTIDIVTDIRELNVEEAKKGFDVSQSQEGTRAKIALNFTYFFLFLVAISIIVPFLLYGLSPEKFSQPIDNAKELVTILASVLAGPFGFIVGFYFKQDTD